MTSLKHIFLNMQSLQQTSNLINLMLEFKGITCIFFILVSTFYFTCGVHNSLLMTCIIQSAYYRYNMLSNKSFMLHPTLLLTYDQLGRDLWFVSWFYTIFMMCIIYTTIVRVSLVGSYVGSVLLFSAPDKLRSVAMRLHTVQNVWFQVKWFSETTYA